MAFRPTPDLLLGRISLYDVHCRFFSIYLEIAPFFSFPFLLLQLTQLVSDLRNSLKRPLLSVMYWHRLPIEVDRKYGLTSVEKKKR